MDDCSNDAPVDIGHRNCSVRWRVHCSDVRPHGSPSKCHRQGPFKALKDHQSRSPLSEGMQDLKEVHGQGAEGLTIDVVAHHIGLESCTCTFHVRNVIRIICWNIPGVSHKDVVRVAEASSICCETLSILQIKRHGVSREQSGNL